MKASKLLSIGAVGLIATLLIAGVVMAAGPNGTSENAMGAYGACDHDRLQDGSCDGAHLQNGGCEQAHDGTMQMERCLGHPASGEGMARSMDGTGHHRSH